MGAQDPLVVILDPGVHWIVPVVAQDAPVVVLDPFMVAVGASGTPVVALD